MRSVTLVWERREVWLKAVSGKTGNGVTGKVKQCLHVRWPDSETHRQEEMGIQVAFWYLRPLNFGERPEPRTCVLRHPKRGQGAESSAFGDFPARHPLAHESPQKERRT